jgi:hypothetical protein
MKPTYSKNGHFITFIVESSPSPIFSAYSEKPFEAIAELSEDIHESDVVQILNLMDWAYEQGKTKNNNEG